MILNMNKIYTIYSDDVISSLRLDVSYLAYNFAIKRGLLQKGINFIKIGEESEIIADGEHSQIEKTWGEQD